MVSVHGYDYDPRELNEIAEVCSFLDKLDDKFPFWLYFLDKRESSLLMVMRCLLATRIETDADPSVQRQHLGKLVSTWWFPALNMVAEQAELTEAEIEGLLGRLTEPFPQPKVRIVEPAAVEVAVEAPRRMLKGPVLNSRPDCPSGRCWAHHNPSGSESAGLE